MASPSILKKYGKYFEYCPLEERMIELAKKGEIADAMLLFEKEKPSEFVYKGDAIEKRLRNIYLSTRLGVKAKINFNDYVIPRDLRWMLDIYESYLNMGENKVFLILGGELRYLIDFFESYLQFKGFYLLVVKEAKDLLRFRNTCHYDAIIFSDSSILEYQNVDELKNLFNSLETTLKVHNRKNSVKVLLSPALPKAIMSSKPYKVLEQFFKEKGIEMEGILPYQLNADDKLLPPHFHNSEMEKSKEYRELESKTKVYIQEFLKKANMNDENEGNDNQKNTN
uniref:Uncharacterized 33.1 kDa protein in rbcL-atpE intergenic region n=1 Tax=Euglena gracilis TaxID=3039 RepID=YCX8_EUGGR|nr:hypothetical protein EugrCp051 [Euglena gracilis]P31919.1 RecName: Full=Uncharacterized 33.1 kDa protein in rbcL-atpE intergenic region; AltName: Full=ORF281B [Euglena gracilis]CAA50126.1 hypothetical protein [Euglena gracilis]